jgi:hypothetical protein
MLGWLIMVSTKLETQAQKDDLQQSGEGLMTTKPWVNGGLKLSSSPGSNYLLILSR